MQKNHLDLHSRIARSRTFALMVASVVAGAFLMLGFAGSAHAMTTKNWGMYGYGYPYYSYGYGYPYYGGYGYGYPYYGYGGWIGSWFSYYPYYYGYGNYW